MSKVYNRESYYKRNPNRKRYAIGYRCTTSSGKVKEFDSVKELSIYTGYSCDYMKHALSGRVRLKNMKVERIYS